MNVLSTLRRYKRSKELERAALELADAVNEWSNSISAGDTTSYQTTGLGFDAIWNTEWQRVVDAKFKVWGLTKPKEGD